MGAVISKLAGRPSTRRRVIVVAAVLAVLSGSMVARPAGPAAAAGTMLLAETFSGATVPDASWLGLSDACLTRATSAPPAGLSNLGSCSLRTDAPVSTANPGWLQLTDNTANRKGGVVYNRPIPATGGLDVSFVQYQYGPTGQNTGADGIGFFLTDGSATLTAAGGPGGSLGYAQNTSVTPSAGVNAGYLGIGLDAFGGFSGAGDGRNTGCTGGATPPGQVPNAIALRGPGQNTTGYCYLAGRSLPTGFTVRTTTSNVCLLCTPNTQNPPAEVGRSVRVTVSPETFPLVTIFMSASVGTALTQVLQYRMTTAAPATYKLGFAASTGGSKDTHLIREVSVSSINALPPLNLVKQVNKTTTQPASYREGDVIPYQFVVSATVAITGLAVADPRITGISCPVTTLAALTSTTCTGSYRVTPTDAVASSRTLTNTATATGTNAGTTVTSNTSSVTVPITAAAPALSLTKTASLADSNGNGVGDVGEQISYTFRATNTGNVTLNTVSVTDARVTGLTPASATLAPSGTQAFTSSVRTITQADVNTAVPIVNTATASGRTTANATVTSPVATASVPIGYFPAISLTKGAAYATGATGAAGDRLIYTFTITNSGNVPLEAVTITDPRPGLSTITFGTWPGTAGSLAIGQSVSATATYPLTQADVDTGSIVNTATTSARTPANATISSTASHTFTIAPNPVITLKKTATPTSVMAAGESIAYTFQIANTGNVTLRSVSVTDPKAGLSAITYGTWPTVSGTLAPGQSVLATATYTTTAADVAAGTVANTATAAGTPPTGAAVTRTASASVAVRPDPVEDTVVVEQGQSITFNVLTNDGRAATGATFTRAQVSSSPKPVGAAASPVPASPGYGSVTCSDSGETRGQCVYIPVEFFSGVDGFDYALSQSWGGVWNVRVTITVTPVNQAPIARDDRVVVTAGGSAATVSPLVNDTDRDSGDTLRITSTSPTTLTQGSFTCSNVTCTYSPAPGSWTGVLTVTYNISDRAANLPGLSATGTISIFVDPPPLERRGFHDDETTAQSFILGAWTRTSVPTAGTSSCVSGRPATTVTWLADGTATRWVLERRLTDTDPAPWVHVADLPGSATSFTDRRVGEGRRYQWRVRPDIHRWHGVMSAATTSSLQPAAVTAAGC